MLLAGAMLVATAYSGSEKSDLDLLQGKWRGTEAGESSDSPRLLSIAGKTLDYRGSDTNDWIKATFTLDETSSPRRLQGVVTGCPDTDSIGKPICAIYQLSNDTFTAAAFAPGETNYPASFDSEGARQLVFKKQPPSTPANK